MFNEKNPLFLPNGSIRAIITLILLFYLFFSGPLNYEITAPVFSLISASVGYYIGARINS